MVGENFIPVIEAFPRDGECWRIDWLGDVFYQRHVRYLQPFIRVRLSKVTLDSSGSWHFPVPFIDTPFQIDRAVPAGLLNLVGIGSIWRDGRLVAEPDYCLESFLISISKDTSTLIKAGVNDDGQGFILPFHLHPHHHSHTHSYCVQVSLAEGKSLIIPVLEIVRFYFGMSSTLISKLFHPPFEQSRFWIKAEKNEEGKVDVDLAKGISGVSAPDVARIAFNQAALHAVKLFTNSFFTSHSSDTKLYPKMLFPFVGKSNLHVKGVWLENNFLVFRFLSCSHPFPFSGLRYTMARRQVTIKNNMQDDATGVASELSGAGKPDPRKGPLTDKAPDKKLAKKQKLFKADVRFPDLEDKYVVRIDPESAVRLVHDANGRIAKLSVGDGENKSGVRSIDLVSMGDVSAPKGHPLEGSEFAKYVEDYVNSLSQPDTSVKYVSLDQRQKYPQFSLMPELIDEFGEIHPMSLIEKKGKCRSRYISIFLLENPIQKQVHMAIEGEDGKQPGAQLIKEYADYEIIDIAWVGSVLRDQLTVN